ncbi:glycoside hydrolase/deacetylase [Rhizoclosmatium globosum]|uniref:Glycoside hydrolase/deacetylase n=1 Tax=Rhizoclosmatium globosum TaxID=329046 RepID=A0A1Y2C5F3_9FUNG|nr:glycoside hydrolase/deacetylase [Rhizoclosmatium globosum]|eukprot:ORY42259.1 glycoside hydrolase/deacetylase [Rhizoclosmatium globosum]
MSLDWAPKPWVKAPPTPVWTQYFKQANPNATVQRDDLRACTIGGKIWGATFDDGPSTVEPALTDCGFCLFAHNKVADKLNQLTDFRQINMLTTFYTIGSVVIQYPNITLDTFSKVHEIGLHTWSHSLLTKLTDDEIVAELVYSAKAVYQTIDQVPKYLRPPYGGSDERVRRLANSMGLTVVGFVDTEDWKYWNSKTQMQPVVTGHFKDWIKNGTAGLITLQHDVWQSEVDVGKDAMDLLVKAGYSIKPVYECLGDTSPYGNEILEGFFLSGQFENKNAVVPPLAGNFVSSNFTGRIGPVKQFVSVVPVTTTSSVEPCGFGLVFSILAMMLV